jgi:hypothetical protein
VTIPAATEWHELGADEIRAMLDAHRPSPHKHRPSPQAVAAVGAYCALRQRTRQRDPDAGDYFDETIDQIAYATKWHRDTVRDVLDVLGDAGWCVTIRRGGRGHGSRRRLTPPAESCGADPATNADESRGADPTPIAGESCGITDDHRGITGDHRGDLGGADPATPLVPGSTQDQRDAPRAAAARASRVTTRPLADQMKQLRQERGERNAAKKQHLSGAVNDLRMWRANYASRHNLKPQQVLQDSELVELADRMPGNFDGFAQIIGVPLAQRLELDLARVLDPHRQRDTA